MKITDEILNNLTNSGTWPAANRGLVRIQSDVAGDWRFLSVGQKTIRLTRYIGPTETITFQIRPEVRGSLNLLLNGCWIPLPKKISYASIDEWRLVIAELEAGHDGECDNVNPIAPIQVQCEPGNDGPQRGSRRHMLDLISSREFFDRINALIGKVGGSLSPHDYFRPFGHSDIQEFELGDFLREAVHGASPNRVPQVDNDFFVNWWPRRGPLWDLVSTCHVNDRPGLLLVESKAHSSEAKRQDRCHGSDASVTWIARSLTESSTDLQGTWPGTALSSEQCYELSNRVAWAWKAASAGIPVILLYLGFTGDLEIRPGFEFKHRDHWLQHFTNYSQDIIPRKAIEHPVHFSNGGQLHLIVDSLAVVEPPITMVNEPPFATAVPCISSLHQEFCSLPGDQAANMHDIHLNELFKTRIQNGDPGSMVLERLEELAGWGIITTPEQELLSEITDLMVSYDGLSLDEVVAWCEKVHDGLREINGTKVAQLIAELTLRSAKRERDTLNNLEFSGRATLDELADWAARGCRQLTTAEKRYETKLEAAFSGAVAGALVLAEFGECAAYHGAFVGAAISALNCFDIPNP